MKQSLQRSNFFSQFIASSMVFVSRLNLLPANISPLGSFGFFGSPVLFVISIIMFDLFVKGVYPGVFFTYLGFLAYPMLGKIAGQSTKKQLTLLPFASFLFFLLSNLGVWWYWYDHTFAQLLVCYGLAVPFYGRTLLSDLFFGYGYLTIKNMRTISTKLTTVRANALPVVLR